MKDVIVFGISSDDSGNTGCGHINTVNNSELELELYLIFINMINKIACPPLLVTVSYD